MSVEPYTKLAQKIVYSSMWEEDGDTCKVWITLLGLKDKDGLVDKNITGIARIAKLPIEKVSEAIRKFESPDPLSTSQEYEGRRIQRCERGWMVLNHGKYMELGWSDEKKKYERDRKAAWRERNKVEPTKEPEPEPAPRFVEPDLQEIKKKAAAIGLPPFEAEKFFNFYSSKGWMVGRNKMKSIDHSLRGWLLRWKEYNKGSTPDGNQMAEEIEIQDML